MIIFLIGEKDYFTLYVFNELQFVILNTIKLKIQGGNKLMKPYIEEFQNEENLEQAVNMLKSKGVQATDLYVLTHDDDRTERISDKADTNLIGVEETGLTKTLENLFVKKGDEIRNKLHELGFSTAEAEMYEEKLDQGKALLIIKNPEQYQLV